MTAWVNQRWCRGRVACLKLLIRAHVGTKDWLSSSAVKNRLQQAGVVLAGYFSHHPLWHIFAEHEVDDAAQATVVVHHGGAGRQALHIGPKGHMGCADHVYGGLQAFHIGVGVVKVESAWPDTHHTTFGGQHLGIVQADAHDLVATAAPVGGKAGDVAVGPEHGLARYGERLRHGLVRGVRQIHQNAQRIATLNHLTAEGTQSAQPGHLGTNIEQVALDKMTQTNLPYALRIDRVQVSQFTAQKCAPSVESTKCSSPARARSTSALVLARRRFSRRMRAPMPLSMRV